MTPELLSDTEQRLPRTSPPLPPDPEPEDRQWLAERYLGIPKDVEPNVFDPDLWCGKQQLTYDFLEHIGMLSVPPMECPDMSAAIRLFKRIDKKVVRIDVVSGDTHDCRYEYLGGEWECSVFHDTVH